MKVPLTPLRFLHRAIDLYPKKVGVVCGAKRFTYAEFGERCQRLASALVRAGVQPGDRVAFLSFNTHQLLEGYYGAPQAHAAVMPLNVRLTPAELAAILHHAEPRILFFENDFAPVMDLLRAAAPGMQTCNLDTEYEDFLSTGTAHRADIATYDEESLCELFYTSGSTGTPKGVMLSHRTVYLHAVGAAACYNHDDTAVDLHTIPLFHANGWGKPQTATMTGVKQVMVRRFEPATVLGLIQGERATRMTLVPTMANALLMFPDVDKYDLSSMQYVMMGGAASSPELLERLERTFRCPAVSGYGLTESSPVATLSRPKCTLEYADDADRYFHQAMAGWPLQGCEIRVVDTELRYVPRDMESIGEVVIAGDLVMDGYYRDPEATAAAITGGWLHTGDMAVWNPDNFIHIVDRQKDIIISGGENISSIEVEKALAAHDSVAEAAVVGAPDLTWGEIPVAIIVLNVGAECSEAELHAFAARRVAKFKLPRRYEFRTEPLPKGGTGKVLKRELREPFWHGMERRVHG